MWRRLIPSSPDFPEHKHYYCSLMDATVVCGLWLLVLPAFFCSLVCLFIGELWDCDWSWKRRSPWAWKVTDPNQQGLLSVMLESLHEWVESSFLSCLVRIGGFSFLSFFSLQHRQSLFLCTVWFLCCLKDTKKACVWNRDTITAKFWFNGVVT